MWLEFKCQNLRKRETMGYEEKFFKTRSFLLHFERKIAKLEVTELFTFSLLSNKFIGCQSIRTSNPIYERSNRTSNTTRAISSCN